MIEILIDFDPLRVQMPAVTEFTGKVRLVLPEVDVKLLDLTMGLGDIMGGAHIGSSGRIACLDMDLGEGTMTLEEMMEFITKAEHLLKEMHAAYQVEFDKRFLLEGL